MLTLCPICRESCSILWSTGTSSPRLWRHFDSKGESCWATGLSLPEIKEVAQARGARCAGWFLRGRKHYWCRDVQVVGREDLGYHDFARNKYVSVKRMAPSFAGFEKVTKIDFSIPYVPAVIERWLVELGGEFVCNPFSTSGIWRCEAADHNGPTCSNPSCFKHKDAPADWKPPFHTPSEEVKAAIKRLFK